MTEVNTNDLHPEVWKLFDRYVDDRKRLLHEPVDDGVLAFSAASGPVEAVELARAA